MVYKSSTGGGGGGGGSGTITQIDTGTGLTGGPITSSGTISIDDSTMNSLAGYDNTGTFSTVTVGSGLSLSGGTLTASGGGSSAFDDITSGTNTTATMTVGTGASLTTSGSGTITATAVPVGGISGLGTGVATFLATPSSANLATAVTDETGSGALVFGTAPSISGATITTTSVNGVTLVNGGTATLYLSQDGTYTTPSGGGSPAFNSITSGTNTTAAMVVGSGASIAVSGSGTITATAVPVGGISGLGTGVGTFLATPSSSNLKAAVTDETGSGALVFANTPTLVTPNIGVATGTSLQLSGLTTSSAVATDGSKNLVSVTNTGTGNNVLATSPTLTTPAIGVATATSINKVAITAPATSATLTIADGSTLATSGANSITLTSTGATNVTLPTTGTLATLAGSETLTNKTLTTAVLGSSTATTQSVGDNSTKVATTAYVNDAVNNIVINTQSNDYTLVLSDNGKFIDMTKGTATTLTIPPNSGGGSVAFPVGAQITIRQGGGGQVTVAITTDTLNNPGATLKTRVQYSQFVITKMASTTWTIIGDAAAT